MRGDSTVRDMLVMGCLKQKCICLKGCCCISSKTHQYLYMVRKIYCFVVVCPIKECSALLCQFLDTDELKAILINSESVILFADISVQCTKCVSNWPAIKIPADSAESVQTFCTAGIENIAEKSNKARLINLCFGIFKSIRCCKNTLVIPVALLWYGVFWWLTDDCCWDSKVFVKYQYLEFKQYYWS